MAEIADVVDRQAAAFRNRDLEGFLACYSPGVKIRDFDGNEVMAGHEAIRGMYGPLFRDSAELSVEIRSRIAAGDYVIEDEHLSGFILAGYPSEMHVAVVYRVRDGLIQDVVLLM
jgi:uncharacterized protein (TIGR02246 family)